MESPNWLMHVKHRMRLEARCWTPLGQGTNDTELIARNLAPTAAITQEGSQGKYTHWAEESEISLF